MRSSLSLPSPSDILQLHTYDLWGPQRVKRCSQVTKGTKGRKRSPKHVWVPGGRITLTPRRQGIPGRPAPTLGWQRTPILPPQGRNWAQAGERTRLLSEARGSQSPLSFLHVPQLTPPCLTSHLCSEATEDSAQPRSQARPQAVPPAPWTPGTVPSLPCSTYNPSSPKAPGCPG